MDADLSARKNGGYDLGMMQYVVYAVRGVCSMQCMLYSVDAVLGVCCIRCMLYAVVTRDHGMERLRAMP